jgi:hypothetical protein
MQVIEGSQTIAKKDQDQNVVFRKTTLAHCREQIRQ